MVPQPARSAGGLPQDDDEIAIALNSFCSGETRSLENLCQELPLAVLGKKLPKVTPKPTLPIKSHQEECIVLKEEDNFEEEILGYGGSGGRLSLPPNEDETPMPKFGNFVADEEESSHDDEQTVFSYNVQPPPPPPIKEDRNIQEEPIQDFA
mmetsp:Transcript_18805/g.28367  ORF Transcript_18805/g.28367 Transcript_18805/m.28367 type:complete len:152 (+) Transcript_18805:74-529(+)